MKRAIQILSICAASLLVAATAQAKGPKAAFTVLEARAYDSAKGPEQGNAESFTYPQCQSLGLLLRIAVPAGGPSAAKAELYYAVEGDSAGKVAKVKQERKLDAGENLISIGDVASLADLLGDDNFAFTVEISAKGYEVAKAEFNVVVHGPPAPDIVPLRVELRNSNGKRTAYFEPGERFRADIRFEIRENKSALQPKVALTGGLVSSYSVGYAADNDSALSGTASGEKSLESGATGTYHLVINGQLPKFFEQPDDQQHAFNLIAELLFGKHRLDSTSAIGVVIDTRSKKDRVKKGYANRSFELDDPENWVLSDD